MSEWIECRIGDLLDVKHGFAFKGENITSEPTDVVLVTPGNFHIGGGFKDTKFKYYRGDYPEDYFFRGGEIVVTMTDLSKESDTLGYSAKIPKNSRIKYLHNQRVGLLQFYSEKVIPDFIYWLMRTEEYQGFIVGGASGTSIMHTSPSRIKEYSFLLPPIPEQRAIASVLSSLDDKIDLLHRKNKTLEAMAETMFRQWFVEEADEGWEERPIGELFNISSGKGLKKEQFIDNGIYPVLGANGEIGRTNNYLYDEKLIFTGRVGTLGNIFIVDCKKVWLSDNTLVVRPHKYFYSVYFILKHSKLEEYNVGSTQPLIRQSDVKEIDMSLPPEETLNHFESLTGILFLKININKVQIGILEKLRDTLLPKLMSGEVSVAV